MLLDFVGCRCLCGSISTLGTAKCCRVWTTPSLGFGFHVLLLGIQKGQAFFCPKFLYAFLILVNRAFPVAGCVRSRTADAVWRFIAVPILTAVGTDEVRCTPLLCVPKFLAAKTSHRIRYIWADGDPFVPDYDVARQGRNLES
jgi:hypothetical protein